MMSKIMHSKTFAFIVLLIIFSFVINTNISYARKISFSLHDGLITTLLDDEEDDENTNNGENDQNNGDTENDGETDKDENNDFIDKEQVVKEGVYKIRCAGNEDYLFDIDSNLVDNNASLQIWLESGSPNQKFYFSYLGEGYYKIASINSAKMIDVPSASTESGVKIQQYEANGSDAQKFKMIENEDGTYSFISKCSGLALDVTNALYENGTDIQQYEANGSDAQKFKLEETELINEDVNDGIISIKPAKSTTMQLDMVNSAPDEGNKVHLWTKASTLAQRFELHRVGENEIRIRTASSGGWLKESSKAEGADVVQSGNSKTEATDSDTWKLEWDNGIILINKESGLVLTINGDIGTNGTEIKVAKRTGNDNQRFIINIDDLIPNGLYKLHSKYGTVLSVPSNSQGIQLKTAADSGSANLIFETVKYSNGYKLMSSASGWTIDVHGGSKDNAAIVQTEIDAGTTSERWIPILQDGGYVNFKNVNSGLMLNVHLFNQQPGAEINQGLEDHSDAQLWRLTPAQLTNAYVRRNNTEYYKVDGSGNFTLIARNVGGWDFTDWDYVMRMRQRAEAVGSATDWFATIDCDKPCRDVFFHRENGQWVAVAGYYAVQGFITLEGGSRTIPGVHTIDHKFERSAAGPGYITSYVGYWGSNGQAPHTPEYDNSQVFHGSWNRGSSGYSTHGCSAVTYEYSKWIYENIPLNTSVEVVGNATGIPKGADPDMPGDVQVLPIQDPFA